MKIKCITLNLWNGGRLFPQIKQFLEHEQPDVVFFQEVNSRTEPELPERFRSVEVLKTILPEYDVYFGEVFGNLHPDYGLTVEGNAIFSRFPLLKCQNTFIDISYQELNHSALTDFSALPEAIQSAEVQIGNETLFLVNVHGPWEISEVDNPRRLAMRDRILELIQDQKQVLVAGDFNVVPNTQTIKAIEEKLTNVFKDELASTFNMQHKKLPGYATSVVDMVFVSSNIEVLSKYCPQVNVSDHLPLVVELEVAS